jgi:mono/diheme cytochrome c family protein
MSSSTNQPASTAPAESTETQSPVVPIWLIVVLFLLLYWGAVYFDEHGGWFESRVYKPFTSADEVKTFNQALGGPSIAELGFAVYNRPTCVVCHQANGQGQPGIFPPLAGSDFVNEKDPGRIIRLVLQGFQGPGLVVSGKPFNTGSSMVPWNSLSDDDIAAVLTYVRGNKEWGNNAPPVTPEQVHAIRPKVAPHPLPYSPDEIMKISPSE